jgi:hypothetical protein
MLSINPEELRVVTAAGVIMGKACRLGGSLFRLTADEVERVLIVTCDPETLWLRRSGLKLASRSLDTKYRASRAYRSAMSRVMSAGGNTVPAKMAEELSMITTYVGEALKLFGDKVEFIDGSGSEISLTINGVVHTCTNHNIKNVELPPGASKRPTPLRGTFFSFPDYDPVRSAAEVLASMVATRKLPDTLALPVAPAPVDWFCARLQSFVNTNECMRCVATLGDSVFARAIPDWQNEPCAFEVCYGPEPHKTIEESVAAHSWNILP